MIMALARPAVSDKQVETIVNDPAVTASAYLLPIHSTCTPLTASAEDALLEDAVAIGGSALVMTLAAPTA